jgi:ribosomal protein L37AE/L43A
MSVRFTQSCPTCGRRIQIRATLLGCTVACQHCKAEFVAEVTDGGATRAPAPAAPNDLMARVERMLEKTDSAVS